MIKKVLTDVMSQCRAVATRVKRLFSYKSIALVMGATLLLSSGFVFAGADKGKGGGGGTTITLDSIQTNIESATQTVGKILTDIAVLAGVGFVLASLFKFHQHKLNPTQVPISQGVTLLLVGAALLVFPLLLSTTTKAIFDTSAGKGSGGKITDVLEGSGGGTTTGG